MAFRPMKGSFVALPALSLSVLSTLACGQSMVSDAFTTDSDFVIARLSCAETTPLSTMPLFGEDIGEAKILGESHWIAGAYQLSARGSETVERSDSFHFAYVRLHGEIDLAAYVETVAGADCAGEAGVMVRDSLREDSPHGTTAIRSGCGAMFAARRQDDLQRTADEWPRAPGWVRVRRVGGEFIGYRSDDGERWIEIGRRESEMGPNPFIGLALASRNPGVSAAATFRHAQYCAGPAEITD